MKIPPETIRKARNTDLAKLVESRGLILKEKGKDLVGLCPFHDDTEPSLIITPGKNLFHCFSCSAGGDPIEFIMKLDGLEFSQAVGRLSGEEIAHSEVMSPETFTLLERIIDHYQRTLMNSKEALAYLEMRGLLSEEAFRKFRIGFADGSLVRTLPSHQTKEGINTRRILKNIGLFRASGHEHLNGALVFPIFDEQNVLSEMYGRRIYPKKFKHLYLPGQHRGLWNPDAFKQKTLVLCESHIDAMSFYVSGVRNVTASFGAGGFTDEMQDAMRGNVQTASIAYDNDASGNAAAQKLKDRFAAEGIKTLRVNFPAGMDANAYLVGHGREAMQDLISAAAPMDREKETPPIRIKETPDKTIKAGTASPEFEISGEEVRFNFSERSYRVRGFFKNTNDHILRVNIKLSRGDVYFLDTIDLLAAKQRGSFIDAAAEETSAPPDIIKYDVGRILSKLEELQEENFKQNLKQEIEVEVPEERRVRAIEYLKDPKLIENIVLDFEKSGLVGERINALIGHLGSLSRRTEKPLCIIIQSSSSAGKSALMEAVLANVPEEDKVKYSFMTGQSLYYMQSRSLKHKIIAISEEEGMEKALYAIKILQSEGKIIIATTVKDPETGLPITKEFVVEGPVMLIITTTNVEIDEELQNRGVILTINESREQTRLIQQLQREKCTLDGILQKRKTSDLHELHQDVQRMIRPLEIVIPFDDLDFPDTRLRLRRDNEKFITLIRSVTLLHQYQRQVHSKQDEKGILEYIVATRDDVKLAVFLYSYVFGISLDDLAPQTRKLLGTLEKLVDEECTQRKIEKKQCRLIRRQIRKATGWNDTRLRKHLERLVDLEYLVVHGGGQGKLIEYELLFSGDSDGPSIPGLEAFRLEGRLARFLSSSFAPRKTNFAPLSTNFNPTSHPVRTPFAPTSHFLANAKSGRESLNGRKIIENAQKNVKIRKRG
jgi:DNA primase catalytic core